MSFESCVSSPPVVTGVRVCGCFGPELLAVAATVVMETKSARLLFEISLL